MDTIVYEHTTPTYFVVEYRYPNDYFYPDWTYWDEFNYDPAEGGGALESARKAAITECTRAGNDLTDRDWRVVERPVRDRDDD